MLHTLTATNHTLTQMLAAKATHTSDIVTAAGVMLGTAGWVFTLRRNRVIARKQFTLQIIIESDFNDEFRKARRSALQLPSTIPTKADLNDVKMEEQLRDLHRVLNHYEFIAAGINRGDFDEETVRRVEGSRIRRLAENFTAWIYQLREDDREPTYFEAFEWLRVRWFERELSTVEKLAELIQERPLSVRVHRIARQSEFNHRRLSVIEQVVRYLRRF